MPDPFPAENDFLAKITEIIEENISNEQFGVSELANEIGMSRSNLLRKIKKLTNLSASQFISQLRLKKAMEILKQQSLTVSEVSYKVGFNSPSYFIKCFREYYGYPPGEAGKKDVIEKAPKESSPAPHSHQLVAIMFTDIRGYTALMQQDEDKAVAFRNRHREIFNAVTAKFKGKILQYYGDGTLSTFSSAIDAVRCGIEMQLAFLEEPQIPVRIGIHSGDIIFTEDDIIGDGVNVASRIETLAAAGSVFISEKVYDEVKNQKGINTASMGVFELKSVEKPIEVFAITNSGLVVPEKDQISGKLKSNTTGDIKEIRAGGKGMKLKWVFVLLVAFSVAFLLFTTDIFEVSKQFISSTEKDTTKKSIAVLPFINDSDDSSNVYFINGLMESILNNLQKIEDMRVISRTSVEKFRDNPKTIPEIADELNVSYVLEGSGQKIGDRILLNVQLIEAEGDKHLWAEQYNREVKDIFDLQMEVAKKIATNIQVIITPEVEERINKIPTENLQAYDHYLKGLDLLNTGDGVSLNGAITWFTKAVELDDKFAAAYAYTAITYYYLDIFQAEKKYAGLINNNADKALLFDPQLPQALVAKGLFYMQSGEYDLALPYLEMAHEYNPNSAHVINTLSDFYANYMPDSEKYLEYAIMGVNLDIAAHDSTTASYIYLHLSNALIQSGFIDEAEMYINKSLDYNPDNIFSSYVRAYILYAKNRDLQQTKEILIETLDKDSSRLDVMQETAKVCYYMRDYESAYHYYKRFLDIRQAMNLDIFLYEFAKIAVVYSEVGLQDESDQYLKAYKEYADNDQSIYKDVSQAVYYSYQGDAESAIKHLKLFSQQDNYHLWTILFLDMDPLMDNIKELPEYRKVMNDIKDKFWERHDKIRASLKEKELL